jgi:hypothetical protein
MDVAELQRLVEYKFAPGPLLAVQGLANTYSFEDDEELLLDPAATREWLVRTGLATPSIDVGARGHERLRDFRRTVRSMIDADGEPAAAHAPAGLPELTAELRVPLTPGPGATLELDLEPAPEIDGVIARMLGIIHRSQLLGEWERLKICASDECRWAFYDSSRNRGGTWCQMEVCGNRIKNRRYRGRRSERSSAQPAR